MTNKHLPPKPEFGSFSPDANPDHLLMNMVSDHCRKIFDDWYEEVFENAVEVYGCKYDTEKGWAFDQEKQSITTHTALLIHINPLAEPTAEDLLREIISHWENDEVCGNTMTKARKYLEGRK